MRNLIVLLFSLTLSTVVFADEAADLATICAQSENGYLPCAEGRPGPSDLQEQKQQEQLLLKQQKYDEAQSSDNQNLRVEVHGWRHYGPGPFYPGPGPIYPVVPFPPPIYPVVPLPVVPYPPVVYPPVYGPPPAPFCYTPVGSCAMVVPTPLGVSCSCNFGYSVAWGTTGF